MQPSLKSLLAIAAVAVAASAGTGGSAVAQTAEAMRTLSASPMDIADGKHLAEIGCAACHNLDGISTVKGTPHIAGQRPAYLYLTLKEYKSGVRSSEAMTSAIKFLSDDALMKVAAYFASLDPAPPPGGPAGPAVPDPEEAGKTASAACAGCHGNTGVSQIPGTPSLIGLDPKYLVDAMKAYKDGQRKNDTMKAMLAAVNDTAMNNLALFYALQKPARAKTPADGDAAAGKAGSASCGGCHGEDGVSGSPATPSLAGQDAHYIAAALQGYKDGSRANDTMKGLAASLDAKAMKNLARLLRRVRTESAERAQAAVGLGVGRALQPLSRRQRQQHRPALPHVGRPTGRVSAEIAARIQSRKTQEHRDARHGRRIERRRYRQSRRLLRASKGARGAVRAAAEVKSIKP